SNFILSNDLLGLVLKGIVCLIVPNLIYVCIFRKTDEFKYLFGIFKNIVGKLLKRSKLGKGISY
ncbi:hypothetical protein V7065_07220, partial [Bacillus sp. JJ63]